MDEPLQEAKTLIQKHFPGAFLKQYPSDVSDEVAHNDYKQQTETVSSFVWQQLSKIYGLKGKLAFEVVLERLAQIRQETPGDKQENKRKRLQKAQADEELQKQLHKAAEKYVLSLSYAQLFSPRTPVLSVIYNQLYQYLKLLNPQEMRWFYQHEAELREKYRIRALPVENYGELDRFLLDCFGDYYTN